MNNLEYNKHNLILHHKEYNFDVEKTKKKGLIDMPTMKYYEQFSHEEGEAVPKLKFPKVMLELGYKENPAKKEAETILQESSKAEFQKVELSFLEQLKGEENPTKKSKVIDKNELPLVLELLGEKPSIVGIIEANYIN